MRVLVLLAHIFSYGLFFFFDNIVHILFVVFFVVFFTSFGNWLKSIMESGFFGFLLCAQLSQISF